VKIPAKLKKKCKSTNLFFEHSAGTLLAIQDYNVKTENWIIFQCLNLEFSFRN